MGNEHTPEDLREGVRVGILTAIERDVERRGGETARRLAAAGVVGTAGAIGLTLLLSHHPFAHHPSWHPVVFGSVWAGLLVVSLAITFLELRTPSLPLARSAAVGILGLGLAGICGAACPDQHFLNWWSGTRVGSSLSEAGGLALSALCMGSMAALLLGGISAFLILSGDRRRPGALLPAAMLLLLLAPGVALQSVGTSVGVFLTWLAGTAAGAFLGVAGGIRARALVSARKEG
jgi:hypothetical protein